MAADHGRSRPAGPSVAIVTGASQGIGLALARHLAGSGWHVAMVARDAVRLSEAAAAIQSGGGTVVARSVDVADGEAIEAFVASVVDRLGPPRALVNNAAVLGPVGPLGQVSLAEIEAALRVNLLGVLAAARAVVRPMGRAGGGVIVNLSGGGIGGPSTSPRLAAYTASKAAVASLTETLGRELSTYGIRVNAIAPGAAATSFTDAILSAGPERAGRDLYQATVSDRARPVMLDRFFDLVDFVLGDDAEWLTGRLLSARWDTPASVRKARDRITSTSLLQLRRIDDTLYGEL